MRESFCHFIGRGREAYDTTGMEGYLIRLPSSAWGVDDDATATKLRNRRARRSCKPQARLLYYVLGEGFLEGFASPDDMEPVESFQLTSFEVDVDPVYSMLMFKVITHEKRPLVLPSPPPDATSDSSDDEDEDEDHKESSEPNSSSLLLFASEKALVEEWCRKLLNWNRYVFAGAPSTVEDRDLLEAKRALIAAFHEKNNLGMFSVICQLQDCTTSKDEIPAVVTHDVSTGYLFNNRLEPPSLPAMVAPSPIYDKLQDASAAPATGEVKSLRMLLQYGSSRRIRSVPMTK
jgi:hypothetical protein